MNIFVCDFDPVHRSNEEGLRVKIKKKNIYKCRLYYSDIAAGMLIM